MHTSGVLSFAMNPNTTVGHIPEETLEQYAMGSLPVIESEPVEEHLLVCEHCRDRLTELDEFVAAMRSALREPPLQ